MTEEEYQNKIESETDRGMSNTSFLKGIEWSRKNSPPEVMEIIDICNQIFCTGPNIEKLLKKLRFAVDKFEKALVELEDDK